MWTSIRYIRIIGNHPELDNVYMKGDDKLTLRFTLKDYCILDRDALELYIELTFQQKWA